MENLDITKLKQIELDILIHIDQFCRLHDIKYTLAYGTLLGAVRHKGFIPWDDDIDILMLREDYNRFEKLYLENDDSHYKLLNDVTVKKYTFPFIKISDESTVLREYERGIYGGVYIDVFPLDDICVDDTELERYSKEILSINIRDCYKHKLIEKRLSILKRIYVSLYKFWKSWNVNVVEDHKKINSLLSKISKGKSRDLVAELSFADSVKLFPKSYFEDIMEIEFEGNKFPIPKEYDKVLSILYGNYMQFPPINERKSGHNFVLISRK